MGSQGWISRLDYEEKGGEYLSEHCASNIFIPLRVSKPATRASEGSAGSEVTPGTACDGAHDPNTTESLNSQASG